MPINDNTIVLLLPELCLVLLATWFFICGTIRTTQGGLSLVAVAGIVVVLIGLYRQDVQLWTGEARQPGFPVLSGPIIVDPLGHVCRWGAVILALLFVLMTYRRQKSHAGEFLACAILAFVGFMLVSTAGDLVLMFLGLELISIPTYILLLMERRGQSPIEATVKYFFLSIFSSAVFLYGLSFIYGVAGSTSLVDIHAALENSAASDVATRLPVLPLGMVLLFAGLAFKIAAVPFHFYAPDVYQATSNANAGLLAVLPKAAGIVALARLVVLTLSANASFGWQIVVLVSIVTMTLGNVCALWQRDIRRMLAYSSIAHAGYMLMGLAVGLAASGQQFGYSGIGASLFYLAAYCIASLGAFAALTFLSRNDRELSQMEDLAGLWKTQPWIAAALAVFMFSLSGIPPFAGFWGKWTLFTSTLGFAAGTGATATKVAFFALAIIAAVNAAIAAGYYLRVVGVMFFADGAERSRAEGGFGPGLAAILCMLIVVLAGAFPGRFVAGAQRVSELARWESTVADQTAATASPAIDSTRGQPLTAVAASD